MKNLKIAKLILTYKIQQIRKEDKKHDTNRYYRN